MRTVKITFYACILIMFMLNFSCQEQEVNPGGISDMNTLEGVIASAGEFEEFEEKELEEVVAEDIDTLFNGEAWKCTATSYDIVDGNPDFPLFNPNSNVIYPGSLLQGKTVNESTPDIIAVKRARGKISHNLINGADPSFEVEEVTKSNIQTAMNSIISNSPDAVAANFSLSVKEVQSREQLALSMGLDVNSTFAEVESEFEFSKDQSYTRFLIKLNQEYFTMSLDIPTSLGEIFHSSVTSDDLAKYVSPGNPPVYVSDVTYGRIFYMLIESTESATKMRASIDASFRNATTQVNLDGDISHIDSLSNLRVKMIAYGGDAAGTLEIVGETDLSIIKNKLSESTDILTAKPISYVVRSIKDNQIVATKLATQYEVTNCEPAAPGKFEFLTLQSAGLEVKPGYQTFVSDANGDGINDIIVNSLSSNSNEVQVIEGSGTGIFTAKPMQIHPHSNPLTLSWVDYEMKTGDINGDGITDLVWNNMTEKNDFDINDNTTYVAIGNGDGMFEFFEEPLVITKGWEDDYNFYLLDIDGNEMDDIIWNEKTAWRCRVYSALSDGMSSFNLLDGYQDFSSDYFGSIWSGMETFIGDVNGDGRGDIIWEETYIHERALFAVSRANEPGKYNMEDDYYLFGYTYWKGYKTHIGDVNGDGRDDVILADFDPDRQDNDYNPIWVGFSNGIEINKKVLTVNMGPEPSEDDYNNRLASAVADINRDGKTDILMNNKDGLTNKIYIGLAKAEQGNKNIFSFETAIQEHPDGNIDWDAFQNPILKDINGDGKADIIWIRPQQSMGIYVALGY